MVGPLPRVSIQLYDETNRAFLILIGSVLSGYKAVLSSRVSSSSVLRRLPKSGRGVAEQVRDFGGQSVDHLELFRGQFKDMLFCVGDNSGQI